MKLEFIPVTSAPELSVGDLVPGQVFHLFERSGREPASPLMMMPDRQVFNLEAFVYEVVRTNQRVIVREATLRIEMADQ